MAAHSYRAWLFEHEGLTVWNAQWYGGHHVLGYSLLFAPLAAAFGPAIVGVLSRDRRRRAVHPARARARRPRPTAAAAASWLFTAGVLSNVAIGRMPFLLGIALAVARLLGGARASGACWRASSALCAMLASPVAGVFLMLGAAAKLIADGRPALRTAAWLALPALAGGIGLYLLFPEGGTDRFAATAFWPMLVISAAGVALLAPGPAHAVGGRAAVPRGADRRVLRAVAVRAERAPARRARRPVRARARAPQARAGVRARGRRRRARCTCSGCRRCARWPRRTAIRPRGSPSRPRRATS